MLDGVLELVKHSRINGNLLIGFEGITLVYLLLVVENDVA